MTIGVKIKKLRKYAGLTQRSLGELSGTSETTIKQYELGKRQPRIEQIKKIAKVFDFPLDLLLDDNFELQKLYEIARQKAHNREKLTDEEEQILIGIPGKMRNKYDDPLSFENSYSFASSEEEYETLLRQRQKQGEDFLLSDYRKLNESGQAEARKRVNELTEVPRYINPDTPPQE